MTLRRAVLTFAGVLLLAASMAHFLGWHQFDAALASIEPATDAALHVGWTWGSVCFATFGVIVLGAALRWRRGHDPRPAAAPVAVALVLFGAGALYCRDFNPHFWGFVALGVLVGVPLLGPPGRQTRGSTSHSASSVT